MGGGLRLQFGGGVTLRLGIIGKPLISGNNMAK